MSELEVTLQFAGGAELLFNNKKQHDIKLTSNEDWNIRTLLVWIRDNLLQDKPELFIQDDSVRPGILVLINDVDWELLDTLNYKIQPKDKIVFISTLHGG